METTQLTKKQTAVTNYRFRLGAILKNADAAFDYYHRDKREGVKECHEKLKAFAKHLNKPDTLRGKLAWQEFREAMYNQPFDSAFERDKCDWTVYLYISYLEALEEAKL